MRLIGLIRHIRPILHISMGHMGPMRLMSPMKRYRLSPTISLRKLRFRQNLLYGLILGIAVGIAVMVFRMGVKDVQAVWSPAHIQWMKRQQLKVVNSSTATLHQNTPIAITVDTKTLSDQHVIKSDCSDLRVTYQPDEQTSTDLTRHLVYPGNTTCSTSTATKVYFNLQADLASAATSSYYYIYYNNPSSDVPTGTDSTFDIGSKEALLVCPFNGTTTCAAAETPLTETGAIRYSGSKSALSFNGKSSSVNSNVAPNGYSQFTAEAWIYPKWTTGTRNIFLIPGNLSINYTSVYLSFPTSNDTVTVNRYPTADISANSWHHYALSYDGSYVRVYVDGVEKSSTAVTGTVSSGSSVIKIGGTDNYFEGDIDEVRISNVARYTSNFTPSTTPFVRDEYTKLLYHFDENGDDPRQTGKAIDDSGNGNHGTITGAKYTAGLVGIDSTPNITNPPNLPNHPYASHEGLFVEEGTTNKITNPSFDHATYNTNWTAATGYELQDEFTTARSAGSVNGTNAEDEYGTSTGKTRTVTDAENKMSIASGALTVAGGKTSPAVGDPGIWWPSIARAAGRTLFADITPTLSSGKETAIGWDTATSGWPGAHGLDFASTNLNLYDNTTTVNTLGTTVSGTNYQVAMVLRSTGAYYYIKGGTYTNWTLMWISNLNSTATLYPTIGNYNEVFTNNFIRVPTATWLPTPLAYDTFATAGSTVTETTGPDSQTTPQLTWTGGTKSGGSMSITPTEGSNLFTDGGFENWNSATDLTSWTEENAGSSTTNRESSIVHGGTYSTRMDIDSSNNGGIIKQIITTAVNVWIQYTWWARTSASGKQLWNGDEYLYGVVRDPGTTWTQYVDVIRSSATNPNGKFLRYSAASSSLYVDDVSAKQLTLASLFSTVPTSDTDVVASADIVMTAGTQAGIVTNLDSTGTPANFLIAYHDGTNVHLDKNVGGTYTSLINTAATYSSGATFRVVTYHSDPTHLKVRVYYNNALVGTEQEVTDASIIGNTKHGLFSTHSGNTFDNFSLFARGSDGEYTLPSEAQGTITASENTTAPYFKFGSKSVKLVASGDGTYTTSITPGNTNTHTLSAYVYDGTTGNVGGTVSSSIAKLVFNGNAVTPTLYSDVGGGWWRLTYSAATLSPATAFGIEVLSGKTIYVDGVQLEEKAYATTYADGSLGTTGTYDWTGTAHNSTSTRTVENIQYASSGQVSATAGSLSLWINPKAHGGYCTGASCDWATYVSIQGSNTIRIMRGASTGNRYMVYVGDRLMYYTSASLTTDAWHHLVLTWDASGNSATFYENGALKTADWSNGSSVNPTNLSVINVGYDSLGTYGSADAEISGLRIYDSVLTTNEVSDLYYSGLASRSDSSATVQVDKFDSGKGQKPMAVWHMDEGYGTTANDATPYLNHLTISGATWIPASAGMTGRGTYLKFDGSNDYLSRPFDRDFDFGTDNFTLSGMFKHPSTVSGTDMILARYGTAGLSAQAGYKVYMNSSGYVCFGIDDDSTWGPDDSACSTVSYADSKWHYYSAVRDTTAIYLYMDGIKISEDTTLSTTSSLSSSSPLYIGIDSDGTSNPWDGYMDEMVIYPYARSSDQVKTDNLGVSMEALLGARKNDNLTDGLVGYWKMDESSGTLTDSSGNGNTGTWSGTGASHYTTGKFTNGSGFNGTDDYVSMGSQNSLNISSSMTIGMWVNITSNGNQAILYNAANNVGYIILFDTSRRFQYRLYGGSGVSKTLVSPSGSASYGSWVYLTAVWDATAKIMSVYANGTSIASSTTTFSDLTTYSGSTFMIGEDFNDNNFKGTMDDVRIYNRALTPAEVTQLADWAPAPVVELKMEEGSGTTLYDTSGNSRNGTLNGNPTWDTGKYGKGVKLDGTGDFIQISDF